jgi:diguanylate cyclase (GGDEF)-like protein
MVQDITARKELELQLQQLASSDTLTGLPNRRHGERFLEAELALCRRLGLPLGVCFFDVDHFKRVNDSFGHLVGDTVLQQVAEQAQASIRRSDLVCRWGGEEFVIISPNSNRAQLLQVAEKVRKAVMALAGTPRVTVSLGVAAFPEDGDDVEALLGVADGALYRAKTRGRNRAE